LVESRKGILGRDEARASSKDHGGEPSAASRVEMNGSTKSVEPPLTPLPAREARSMKKTLDNADDVIHGLGITDDVIDDLARAPAFRVLGTASTMRFQNDPEPPWQIARQLRADEVVEGTVTQSGDRIRIAAQLVSEPADRILWAHEFVRNASDLLSLKKEVARSIATAVETAPMSDRVPAPAPNRRSNADARLNYFKGLRFRRLPLLENSTGLFEAPRQRFRTSASRFAATAAGPDRFPSLPQAAPRKAGLE